MMGMLASQTTVLKQMTRGSVTFQELFTFAERIGSWFPKMVVRWH